MRIVTFTPYGTKSQESNLISMLANYIEQENFQLTQFRCNGVFSLCDRDQFVNWRRELSSCMNCTSNQKDLQVWAGTEALEVSSFISNEEIQFTKRELQVADSTSLKKLSFKGVNIFDLCKDYFNKRFGTDDPDLANKKNEQVVRRAMLSALRMMLATQRFNNSHKPELVLVGSGRDMLSASYLAMSGVQKIEAAVFNFIPEKRITEIKLSENSQAVMESLLTVSDISVMRSESNTWPAEIKTALDEILTFLNITGSTFKMQLAR